MILLGFTGFLGMSGFYLALQFTELSKATALYWTNPMFTAVIAYLWLKESLNFVDWIAIFTSFAGILVILNPWTFEQLKQETTAAISFNDLMGTLSAVGGAIFYSIS